MENFEFNTEKIEKAAELLKAVAHHLRLRIIKLIHEKKEVNVNVIYNTLKIEQSITSQHLKILRGVDVVRTRRDGKKIYYSLNYDRLDAMHRGIDLFGDAAPSKKAAKKKK
ncbi:MAG TPA: metalloregulator ArsR/SmtB family transcription factor [Chitinophagales bacterium]|nr:metalloregulator ArsR/SmtB family transcription factor [Chitinophagales bacterium]HNM32678.1 metalloregulator ArsR/SmtB family transcription factor [Chitinophagales bacterium]